MDRTRIALFPLSNVVLFPLVQTPLHIFEPRYRQMTADAIDEGGLIGMVVVPPEHAHAMGGSPPVYPIGCAGRLAQVQRLPDGRYNLVLAGLQRFRILDEPPAPPQRLYRVAEVELLGDPYPDAERERVAELRNRILAALAELLDGPGEDGAAAFDPAVFDDMDDATFVNSMSCALALHPQEKQGLLEADSVPQRFDRLEGLLAFRLAELRSQGTTGSDRIH